MSSQESLKDKLLDPDVMQMIDQIVDKKIEEKLGPYQKKMTEFQGQIKQIKSSLPDDQIAIVAYSGDMDTMLCPLLMSVGAVSLGMKAKVFFSFWGVNCLKKETIYKGKSFMEKMMTFALPSGPNSLGTSKMNMMGVGPAFFKTIMKKKNITSLPELIEMAQELGVEMTVCQMSMDAMGIVRDELIDGVKYGGVALFLKDAAQSKINLFV